MIDLAKGTPNIPAVHVAFRVPSRKLVEAFYHAALEAGGRDNGPPGLRPHYDATTRLSPRGNP
jgi:hypothetical protein